MTIQHQPHRVIPSRGLSAPNAALGSLMPKKKKGTLAMNTENNTAPTTPDATKTYEQVLKKALSAVVSPGDYHAATRAEATGDKIGQAYYEGKHDAWAAINDLIIRSRPVGSSTKVVPRATLDGLVDEHPGKWWRTRAITLAFEVLKLNGIDPESEEVRELFDNDYCWCTRQGLGAEFLVAFETLVVQLETARDAWARIDRLGNRIEDRIALDHALGSTDNGSIKWYSAALARETERADSYLAIIEQLRVGGEANHE